MKTAADEERRAPQPGTAQTGQGALPGRGGRSVARFAWIGVVILVGLFFLATLRSGQDWTLGDDFAQYILHARNLAQGRPYADTGYIYNPDLAVLGPPAYPPILPLLLAPVYALAGLNLAAMKVLIVVLFLAALAFSALLVRGELGPFETTVMVAIVGLNPFFWDLKDDILSDIPFLCFTYAGLLLAQSVGRWRPTGRALLLSGIALGLVLYLGYGTRAAGLALVGTVLLSDLVASRRVRPTTAIGLAVFGVLAVVQYLLIPGVDGYVDLVRRELRPNTIGSQLVANGLGLGGQFLALWAGGVGGAIGLVLFSGLTALSLLGYLARLRSGVSILELFPVVYLALILAWPRGREARFLVPLVPLSIYYALLGLRRLPTVLGTPRRPLGAAILCGAVLVAYGPRYATVDFGPIPSGAGAPDSLALFDFVASHRDNGEPVVFRRPRALALFTGRPSAAFAPVPGGRDLATFLRETRPAYVVASPRDRAYWSCVAGGSASGLRPAYANETYTVYAVAEGWLPTAAPECDSRASPDEE